MPTTPTTPSDVVERSSSRRGTRRHLVRGALAATAAGTALVLGTGTAQAGIWGEHDTFNDSPAYRWSPDGVGKRTASFPTSGNSPVSGGSYGLLTTTGPGWSSLGRKVHLSPAQYHASTCGASVSVRGSAVIPTTAEQLNIEVIDPVTWRYIALSHATVTGSGWVTASVGPWTPGPVDVFFRVSLAGASGATESRYAGLDDLVVTCTYAY